MMKVRARELQPGDVLKGTGETIVRVSAGVRTPTGKVEVTMQRPDGSTRVGIWNRATMIGVKDPVTTPTKEPRC